MKVLENKTIISNPDSIFNYFAWPSVTRLDDNTLACTCSGFRLRHLCPFGKACISYSYDDGLSWTNPTPIIDTPLDDRDTGIVVKDNLVIITSFNNTPEDQKNWERKALETGDTSAKMKLISAYNTSYPDNYLSYLGSTYKVSRDYGKTFGEMKKCPVSTPHGPFLGNNGDILYVGKRFRYNKDDGIDVYKKNENDEFEYISSIPMCEDEYGSGFACEPHGITLPSGKILVAIRVQRFREHPQFTIYLTESNDNGKTFCKPYKLLPDDAGSPPHFLLHSSGALIMTYARRANEYGIRYVVSYDEGKTFSKEYILNNDSPSSDLGYPCSVERKDGKIITVFYERGENGSDIKQITWEL